MTASSYEAPEDTHTNAAHHAEDLGAWPGAWRRIDLDDFVFDLKDNARHRGYAVTMMVKLFGHDYCKCHRSVDATAIRLFLPHPIGSQFPVHHTISGSWLAYASVHGFGCPLPGVIAEEPWTWSISYGYLNSRHKRHKKM